MKSLLHLTPYPFLHVIFDSDYFCSQLLMYYIIRGFNNFISANLLRTKDNLLLKFTYKPVHSTAIDYLKVFFLLLYWYQLSVHIVYL